MFAMTKHVFALSVLVCVVQADDTCNQVSKYMVANKQEYSQRLAKIPDERLNICNEGTTCCTEQVEELFYEELDRSFRKINFHKDFYIKRLAEGRTKIGRYITQILTLTSVQNSRTDALVSQFLEMSDSEVQGMDSLPYPVSALVDMADSHGVTDLLWEDQGCIREMMDFLVKLGELQLNGLTMARLLYRAIPEGIKVLEEMKDQSLSEECLQELVRSHRCNFCLDSTSINVRTCRGLCMTVATKCYSHLAQVADTWEEYAELTEQVMDVLDKFAKVYEQGLSRTIQQILTKLKDHDTADMCGYDVASNLARHHKREADLSKVPQSKIRDALFNGGFMVGMLGSMDEIHCNRFSTINEKCWNGSTVGLYTGDSDISINNTATVTEDLLTALNSLEVFNKEFKAVNGVKLVEIAAEMNNYNLVTDEPDFVDSDNSAVSQTLSVFLLFLPSILL